jgi:predicted RecB family nuclease
MMSPTVVIAPSERPPQPQRTRTWVSKSDLIRYLRCPYAFWMVDSGRLAPQLAIDQLGEQLIQEGVAFERSVTSVAQPLPPEIGLADALRSDARIYGLPHLENPQLKLHGIPDAVDAAAGALIPVEIKSHRTLQRTDELELAFYWRLLEPYRTADSGPARGRLILRRDGEACEIEVRLTEDGFSELDAVIGQVRDARRRRPRPRVCGCPICSGPLREQIDAAVRDGKDLSLIWGIGRQVAEHLEASGIADYEQLGNCDPAEIVSLLRNQRVNVSAHQVTGWIEHARSYGERRAIIFGSAPPIGDRFIALDMEYDTEAVWLTAVLISAGDKLEYDYFWADTPREEREAITALDAICAAYPDLPIITWNGVSADLPNLLRAANRHSDRAELVRVHAAVQRRHVDLFQHAARSLRLPVPGLTLKEVSAFFGVPRVSPIAGGLEAQFRYHCYRMGRNEEERAYARRELLAYNRDDLEALVAVARIMSGGQL